MQGEANWLNYYGNLRQYKEDLENRFVKLMLHQSIAAFAAITVMQAIGRDGLGTKSELLGVSLRLDDWGAIFVGGVGVIGLLLLCYLTVKYFRQTREVGMVMAEIECYKLKLAAPPRMGGHLKISDVDCFRSYWSTNVIKRNVRDQPSAMV